MSINSPTLAACLACGRRFPAEDGVRVANCPACESDDIATFSRIIGYVKMIARKRLRADQDGFYRGEHNFWSRARRWDWQSRKRLKECDVRHT